MGNFIRLSLLSLAWFVLPTTIPYWDELDTMTEPDYADRLQYTTVIEEQVVRIYETHQRSVDLHRIFHPYTKPLYQYLCRDHYFRYATVNGSEYVYNITDRFRDYYGYDSITQAGWPNIDRESKTVWFSHSQPYYRSYSSQAADAYEMFIEIGQMP